MTETSLQDRLRDHAKAFDGLLSLIPAKMYYGEDTSDQWNKKKQTKAEARAARRGKLDPDSKLNRNAKEVMDERARNKRKLKEMQEDEPSNDDQEDDESVEGVQRERPGEGLRKKSEVQTAKKQKTAEDGEMDVEKSARQKAREERRLLKLEKKAEKKRQKADTGDNADGTAPPVEAGQGVASATADPVEKPQQPREDNVQDSRTAPSTEVEDEDGLSRDGGEMAPLDVSGLVSKEDNELPSHTSTPNSGLGSPVFDTVTAIKNASVESASTTTSLSSTVPPSERPRHIKVPTDTSALRIRLAAKIEALRAARKADGADGRPIRTRQELIESRREKQAQRKAHKKEMRQLAKAEEERKREEALASARNSPGGALSPMIDLGDDEKASTYFAFGRVAFADGTQMSHDLSYTKGGGKKKGPSDPKTALAKLEAQKKRIAGLDEDKRKEVLEKETWLAARRRAEGSKVHDDEALLKKAVKRKERSKKKSENEWKERTKGVENAIKERQRKREDNIRKRKEDKMLGKAGKKKAGKAAKRNRAGFEGSFGGRRPR